MDDAQSRQRGPPPPADERSSTRHPPAGQVGGSHREQWQREGDRLPLRSRAPLDDDRFTSRKASMNGPGSSTANGAGPAGGFAAGAHDKRTEHPDRAGRTWSDERDPPKRWARESQEPHYNRSGRLSMEGVGSGGNGPPYYRKRDYNDGGSFPQRSRSQSPPGPSSTSSVVSYSNAPMSRQHYEQQQFSPPKRSWGGREAREPFPSSSAYADTSQYDRDGPYRGHRGGTSYWNDRRSNGPGGNPAPSTSSDRFGSRTERDGRSRLDEPLDRRPLDSSWSRQSKFHGDANAWRDDKGKGPANEFDVRRPSLSRYNQNNPPHTTSFSTNGPRARSPESNRARERRSPSFDDYPSHPPGPSTMHVHSRHPERVLSLDHDRQRNPSQLRSSASTNISHPPFIRSSSAGQPANKRDFALPPDRPSDALATRLGRSASVSQDESRRPAIVNNGWSGRRRSLSASPSRENSQAKEQSSPRSLAERLGPLASGPRDLQDRIEPIVFRGRTPPPRSPIRQSAPSTLQRNRSPVLSPKDPAVVSMSSRSFTPPLPSPARRTVQQANSLVGSPAKAGSPSPKLASSPSDAANSSPRPSTTDLEQASSEVTQARTSPDIGKDDESTQEGIETRDSACEETLAPEQLAGQTDSVTHMTSERMPRAPIPLRSTEVASTDSRTVEAEFAGIANIADVSMTSSGANLGEDEAVTQEHQDRNAHSLDIALAKIESSEYELKCEQQDGALDEMQPGAVVDASSSAFPREDLDIEAQRQAQHELIEATVRVEERPHGTETGPRDEEAIEEDLEAQEFEKSLISFIQTNDAEEEEASVDLSAILEDNKLKAPVSLPVAIHMPVEGQDVLEVKPLLLQNHDLLDGWLRETMASRDKRRGEKILRLRQRYKELDAEWHAHCTKLEKMRERQKKRQNIPIAPPTPSVDSAGISIVPTTPNLLAPSGRSNRRSAASSIGYGDAVRSEAEFLEILASLEDADMRDPNLRAMRTTATVPDQIIDESEYTLQQYEDNNGLVTDPFEYYQINKTPDSWTEDEIAIFCRRYALYPKQFGKIAAALPDKTTSQCVLFYYRSKKKIDFRALVDRRNRDGRRKRAKGEKGAGASGKKGPSLLNNIERARGAEDEEEDDDEPQTPGSAMAQESTVLSTARALTRQLNGTNEALARSETAKRPSASRVASNRKAARFLSPSADRSGADEGVPPASDGVLAAAEALGFLSNVPDDDSNEVPSRPNSAKQKKRKPSMSESILNTSVGEDGTTRQINMAKRSRPHSSSYWSVADKNEFMRLLSIHGKNYTAIAEGIQSKTAVQCKNFFQNNTKKMGLAEIAARAEGDFANISGELGLDSPMEGVEVPSVFGEPDSSGLHEPPSGYFIPSHHGNNRDGEEQKPYARSGGMHLRNLLDDAPDAEGGAHAQAIGDSRMPGDDDSATEDEAEPARYTQENVDARGALIQAHADRTAAQQRYASRIVKEEMLGNDSVRHRNHPVENAHYPPHMRSSSYGSRPEYVEAGHFSPTYQPASERGFSMPPRQVYSRSGHGQYDTALPPSGHWSPYEGRSIYGPPAGSGYVQRSAHAYYRHEYHHGAYSDSPVHDKASQHRSGIPPRPQHGSPFYSGGAPSPPLPGSHPPRRISDSHVGDVDQAYYEHYGTHRAR